MHSKCLGLIEDLVYLINDEIRPNNYIDKNKRSNQGDKCKPQLIYYT